MEERCDENSGIKKCDTLDRENFFAKLEIGREFTSIFVYTNSNSSKIKLLVSDGYTNQRRVHTEYEQHNGASEFVDKTKPGSQKYSKKQLRDNFLRIYRNEDKTEMLVA